VRAAAAPGAAPGAAAVARCRHCRPAAATDSAPRARRSPRCCGASCLGRGPAAAFPPGGAAPEALSPEAGPGALAGQGFVSLGPAAGAIGAIGAFPCADAGAVSAAACRKLSCSSVECPCVSCARRCASSLAADAASVSTSLSLLAAAT